MKKVGKWILVFIGAIAIVLLLRGFFFTTYIIPSSGMENTLFQGDRIFVNKWSYGLRLPCMSLISYHRWCDKPIKPGDIVVFNNPVDTDKPVIDKRRVFINRCLGSPGDTLVLDSLFKVSSWEKAGPERKELFSYPKANDRKMDSLLIVLNLAGNELMGSNDNLLVRAFSRYEYYLLEQALQDNNWVKPFIQAEKEVTKPLIVPQKGKAIDIHPWNVTLYRNTILLHEGKAAEIKNDSLYIDGHAVSTYIFSQDYYWMMSDNSINTTDSRLFGFVPRNHVIGKVSFIWFSKEAYSKLTNGYRWNRFFKAIK